MKNYQDPVMMRTLAKMKKSELKKKELVWYIEKHCPELLWSERRATRIKTCCNYLRFVDHVDWRTKLHSANFCKYDKFCLACATRRSIKKIQSFIAKIQDNNWESKHWYHVTLTIRHHKWHSLEELMDKLIDCRKRMAQKVRNSRRENHKEESFFALFDWMIASIEVTYSEKSWWHPHMHLLVCSDDEITDIEWSDFLGTKSNRRLQKERYKITTDSYCVAMRKVEVDKHHFERQWIAEVFKYAIKFTTLSIQKLVELMKLQKKRRYRFYSSYGVFR